jgi:hypothetical protein
MDTDMRIPLTSEQKALIDEATRDEPEGKAAWARAILLQAARAKVGKPKGQGPGTAAGARPEHGRTRQK